ncbi:hypothetical protein SHKM778_59710 [Streptomyces sp. KM77-8]|uniref:Transposase n=1 Tax=Streptomyces haneummycinicus TaxID=3074435 RepID=A0AAT9HQE2_9ACTN
MIVLGAYPTRSTGLPVRRFTEPGAVAPAVFRWRCGFDAVRSHPINTAVSASVAFSQATPSSHSTLNQRSNPYP